MARLTPHTLRLQISRMLEQGQSLFCTLAVQDWLRDRNCDPDDYTIQIHQQPAPPGTDRVIDATVELTRKDGQPVEPWLLEQLNQYE